MDGPVVIPGLYDGRNKTFFMGAYEGVRARRRRARLSRSRRSDAAGNFSEISTPIRNPFTGQPFPGNIIPSSLFSPTSRELLKFYPAPNRAGIASNLQAQRQHRRRGPVLARVDQNLGNKVRLYVRYNWHDSYNATSGRIPVRGHAAARQPQHAGVVHAHAEAEPAQRFPDRLSPHRLRHLESLLVNGPAAPGRRSAFPASMATRRFNNPGLPSINISNFNGLGTAGTNWFQFDTTFQVSNVLAYKRGSHNIRTGFDLRRMATGRRAANDPRGRFNFNGGITGYSVADFMLGLPRTVITPADQIQGHVGGWRNGFFVNDVWQATRNLTLSLGLRYELNTPVQTYEGLASMLAEDLETIIPTQFPAKGFEFHEPNYKDFGPASWRHLSAQRENRPARGLRDLLQPEPDELVHVPDQQPAAGRRVHVHLGSGQSNAVLPNPVRSGGPGGPPGHDFAYAGSAQRAQEPVELRHSARALAGTALDLQYVGSNTSNLDRSFFNNTPQPGPGAIDPRRPSQRSAAAASSRTT